MKDIPKRSARFLAGTGKGVMPKRALYEAAVRLWHLERALMAGFKSVEEYDVAMEKETEKWFEETFKK